MCFFFSSRRRHTRCGRDWSSDVCSSDLPLPWERLLWHGRPALLARLTGARAARARYLLTDFRLVSKTAADIDEIALQDIGEVHRRESPIDRWIGASTIEVHARDDRRPPLILH